MKLRCESNAAIAQLQLLKAKQLQKYFFPWTKVSKAISGLPYGQWWSVLDQLSLTSIWDIGTMQRILPFWTLMVDYKYAWIVHVSWLKLGEGHTFYLLVDRETKRWRGHDPASWLWRWPKSRLKVWEKCQSLISHRTDLKPARTFDTKVTMSWL